MGNHRQKSVPLDGGWTQKRCTCGWLSKASENWREVEDEVNHHLADVERLKANLSSSPSMRAQRDYFRACSENAVDYNEEQRRLWGQLADELDKRLNDGTQRSEQSTLF